uniref:J domain-containing protein n=1 Tax=Glossina palpalis gambiensis TaxID=67801 RepID=A0A1B0C6Q3_9MUSC
MDHRYKLLGVSKNANTIQINAAYYTLPKNFYDDANSGTENESQRFRDIMKAYNCIVNNVKNHENKLDAKHMNIEKKRNYVTTSSSKSQAKFVPSLLDPPTEFINRRKPSNSAKDTLQTVATKESKALHLIHFLITVRKCI